jgi:RNA polymerase sigma-B factor
VPDDAEIAALFAEYLRGHDRRVRDQLVTRHRWLAIHCARRFSSRGEPFDDLVQVAQLGLLKAVERFDPSFGVKFPTFAMPTILGELRRHFRDHTWPLRVPRRLKEMYLELSGCVEVLRHELGRAPLLSEIADARAATVEDVTDAMEAGTAYRTWSFTSSSESEDEDQTIDAHIGNLDAGLMSADSRIAVRAVIERLPSRERRVLYLRYFEGRTQADIAAQFGISQVHVSRIIRATLRQMRAHLAASA